MLTQEEIRNLLLIISRPSTTIQANEAIGVAMLQQKLNTLLQPVEPAKEEKKK